jgi:hypothetical protein
MIFDDYQWKSTTPEMPQSMPLIAIDAFVSVFKNEIRMLHQRWQVAVEKLPVRVDELGPVGDGTRKTS